jgi:hypothetical protein
MFLAFASLVLLEAQPTLTPELIRKAISLGMSDSSPIPASVPALMDGSTRCGAYYPPFWRVTGEAWQAKTSHRPFGPSDVSASALAPEFMVFASDVFSRANGKDFRLVKLVTVAPKGSSDPAEVKRPLRTTPSDRDYANGVGPVLHGRAITAYFPLALLKTANEVRVAYETGPECRAPLAPEAEKP